MQTESTVLKVGGMTCQGCVNSVTKVLEGLPGVARVEVSLNRGEARVDYDGTRVSREDMKRVVDEAGFEAA
ncbi:MAG: heavy-metal-associated domain-containing protein [Pseudomonadota bacterium]